MSRIKSRDTTPERVVRSILHRLGFRFRLHGRALPGRPDVVLSKHGVVVLVHGCFWHRHSRCRFAYTPKSNLPFWLRKFEENVARDLRTVKALRAHGWRIVTVWECQTVDVDRLTRTLAKRLRTFALTAKVARGRMPKTFPARIRRDRYGSQSVD
jgi:DNA mismatch endonuclease (patch repair protein)